MADEVIIVEMQKPDIVSNGTMIPVIGKILTTQVVDIATLSAQLNANTDIVRLKAKGTGFWYITGGSGASAAANTNGNDWIAAGDYIDIEVKRANGKTNFTYIDTAADA